MLFVRGRHQVCLSICPIGGMSDSLLPHPHSIGKWEIVKHPEDLCKDGHDRNTCPFWMHHRCNGDDFDDYVSSLSDVEVVVMMRHLHIDSPGWNYKPTRIATLLMEKRV